MRATDRIVTADAFGELAGLDPASVHAVVTDPPYGLAFMGKSWDDFEPKEFQEWCEEWASLALDALKPGGHLLAFGGGRTEHRLKTGVEDAGFEIRGTVTWHYSNGFPKGLDVSKDIDKRRDADREVIGTRETASGARAYPESDDRGEIEPSGDPDDHDGVYEYTAPATDDAEEWDGWKTTLKPATEFVAVARKPISEDSVAENVLEHGTGALNIDGCRVDGESGRYPSNVVFDEAEAGCLDAKNDETSGTGSELRAGELSEGQRYHESGGTDFEATPGRRRIDSGGPSRYFYTSKATKAERTLNGRIKNGHPTVKPLDLMEWLVTLVTREDQLVVDPFCGTGTTCRAAKALGRHYLGIEENPRWADVARVRCGLSPDDPSHVRSDTDQAGIEAFITDGGQRNPRSVGTDMDHPGGQP